MAGPVKPVTVFYTPDKLGPLCASGCGWRLPLALAHRGILTHPTCGPAKGRGRR